MKFSFELCISFWYYTTSVSHGLKVRLVVYFKKKAPLDIPAFIFEEIDLHCMRNIHGTYSWYKLCFVRFDEYLFMMCVCVCVDHLMDIFL